MNITTLVLQGTDILRKNQYPIGKIGAIDFKYSPKSHQLFIKAQARPSGGIGNPYQVSLAFSGIQWSDVPDPKFPIRYDDEKSVIYLQQVSVETRLQIRCTCKDDYFMWQYPNKQAKSLLGKFKPYVRKTTYMPPRNPGNVSGMCKHTLGLIKILMQMGVIKKDPRVSEYLNRPTRKLL